MSHLEYLKAAPNGMIEITVSDSGVGIQDKDKDKLFQLFGFLETTKELNTKGIGLGLHISKEIVKQFGGDICFNSEWQVGTNFTFVLALDQDTSSENEVARNKNPKMKYYPKMEVRRYLKKEDDLTLRESNCELFCPINELIGLNSNV